MEGNNQIPAAYQTPVYASTSSTTLYGSQLYAGCGEQVAQNSAQTATSTLYTIAQPALYTVAQPAANTVSQPTVQPLTNGLYSVGTPTANHRYVVPTGDFGVPVSKTQ